MIEKVARKTKLNAYDADEILRIAFEKGFIKSDDVLEGCDYYAYNEKENRMEFHITDPSYWEYLSAKEFIGCYIELLKSMVREIDR